MRAQDRPPNPGAKAAIEAWVSRLQTATACQHQSLLFWAIGPAHEQIVIGDSFQGRARSEEQMVPSTPADEYCDGTEAGK